MPDLTIRQPLTAERLRELADRGLSQTEIAAETGYSRQRVNSACRAAGIEPAKKPWSPPAEHQQRATAARLAKGAKHIEAIRQCAADGMTATEAAAKLGVTRATVYSATSRHKIAFGAKAPSLTREQALKRKRELAVQRRAARRAAGLCAKCGKCPPADGKALCTACTEHESKRWHRGQQGPKSRSRGEPAVRRTGRLDRQRAYMAERNAKLKATGICTKCATAPAVPLRTKCAACALADAERKKLNKPAKPPKAANLPLPGTRRLSLPPCAICGRKMNERTAAAQVKLYPGITVYPRCRECDQSIARSVQGIRSARAARQDGEGEA